jgi:hypothetical protein
MEVNVARQEPRVENPFDKLEAATRSLAKEREFFDALMQAEPVAIVVNRIIHLTTFFTLGGPAIALYLERHAARLFPNAAPEVAGVLAVVLNDIVQSARLAAYLCVKGIPDQALVVLRGAVEHLGVYTHVWREPDKHRFVPDSESDEFTQAFRCTRDKALTTSLKAGGIRYRFMHCNAGRQVSNLYGLLSAHFVHGRPRGLDPMPRLSCEFVDRAEPQTLAPQYALVQAVMPLLWMELIGCIPADDLLTDELAGCSIAFAVFGSTLAAPPGDEDPELTTAVTRLLNVLSTVKFDASD